MIREVMVIHGTNQASHQRPFRMRFVQGVAYFLTGAHDGRRGRGEGRISTRIDERAPAEYRATARA